MAELVQFVWCCTRSVSLAPAQSEDSAPPVAGPGFSLTRHTNSHQNVLNGFLLCSKNVNLTFFRPNVADELHLAAPCIKGVQDALRVSWCSLSENVLEGPLLSTQTSDAVLPYSDQEGSIEQHKVEPVPDDQRQQEGEKSQSYGRRHHPDSWRQRDTQMKYCIFSQFTLNQWFSNVFCHASPWRQKCFLRTW